VNRHLVREGGHVICECGHLVCERGHAVRKHRRLIGGKLSGLCWLEGLHRLNRRGLCGSRHGLYWRGLLCRGGLGRWRGSLSRFKNLSRNIQYDDQTHNRQQQHRPHIFTFHKVPGFLFGSGRHQRVVPFSLSTYKLRAGPGLCYGVFPYRSSRPGSAGTDQTVAFAGWLAVFSSGLIQFDLVGLTGFDSSSAAAEPVAGRPAPPTADGGLATPPASGGTESKSFEP